MYSYARKVNDCWVIDLLDVRSMPVHSQFYHGIWLNFSKNEELSIFADELVDKPEEFVAVLNHKLQRYDATFRVEQLTYPFGNQWIEFKTHSGLTAFILENCN